LRCLCYLFSAKTAWQLVNRKADFFTKQIDSHNESNRIDSNRELECSSKDSRYSTAERRVAELIPVLCSQPAGDVSH